MFLVSVRGVVINLDNMIEARHSGAYKRAELLMSVVDPEENAPYELFIDDEDGGGR